MTMKRAIHQLRRFGILAAGIVFLTAGVGLAVAEQVTVNSAKVKILAGKGLIYGTVTEVKKGDSLEVIAREGNWLKVKANGQEGYVMESALGSSKGLGGLGDALAGGSGSSGMSTGAAAKGLNARKLAASRNQSPRALDDMEATRKRITLAKWKAFADEGKVGPK